MEQMTNSTMNTITSPTAPHHSTTVDFAAMLTAHQVAYQPHGPHLLAGELTWSQGWMLDLTVVKTQIHTALTLIIPWLRQQHIPFKVVRNMEVAESVLNGKMGFAELGKVITVYPPFDQIVRIARYLIELLADFRGPAILTDAHLGAVVYTRYGACNAVVKIGDDGMRTQYIYNAKGELEPEPIDMPFQLRSHLQWPFDEIRPYRRSLFQTTLLDKYRPMGMLKNDVKGWVRKGLWLKKLYWIKWVVIKEGKSCMCEDNNARDMGDRLRWQYDIHKNLEGKLPLPKVYDLFVENGNTYLIMERIKGTTLDKIIMQTFRFHKGQDNHAKEKLLGLCLKVLEIIRQMHTQGYIHRDITPANFMVDKNDSVWLIDLELTYSIKNNNPSPPFTAGTPGYMSFEQSQAQQPTVAQDIYAIGAMLISALTNLSPDGFATDHSPLFFRQLRFFMPEELAAILVKCLSFQPQLRPTLAEITKAIDTHRLTATKKYPSPANEEVLTVREQIETVIPDGIAMLASPHMATQSGLWIAKSIQPQQLMYSQQRIFTVDIGLYNGISGVIFLLAQANKMGYQVSACQPTIERNIECIRQRISNAPAGLFNGSAGVAMALSHALQNGLISEHAMSNREVKTFLLAGKPGGWNLSAGLAGYAAAMLKIASDTGDQQLHAQLGQLITQICEGQGADGSWRTYLADKSSGLQYTGLGMGTAGVVSVLLEYLRICGKNPALQSSIEKALIWLMTMAKKQHGILRWRMRRDTRGVFQGMEDGEMGVSYCLLKAFEVLGNPLYREAAEQTLSKYDPFETGVDLTAAHGLVGRGEVMLEAHRILGDQQWYQRAGWIATFLNHYYRRPADDVISWYTDATPIATPSLLLGNCGIIHFLLRYNHPGKLDHPMLI